MADTSKGWIMLFRSMQDHWLWKDRPFSKGQAWIDLLLDANHESHKLLFSGELITIKRGQVLTSKVKLAQRWGWDRKTVTSFLDVLKADNQADTKADNKCTLITITNYNQYQDLRKPKTDTKADNKADVKRTATGQQRDTNKECKELKEHKEYKTITTKDNTFPAAQEPSFITPVIVEPRTPQEAYVLKFKELYYLKTGMPYKDDRKHYVIVAGLIKKFGMDLLLEKTRILAEMCEEGKGWFVRDGWADFTIEKISLQWSSILRRKTAEQKEAGRWSKLFSELEAQRERVNQTINTGRTGTDC